MKNPPSLRFDHVAVPVHDAKAAYDLFAETLGLPLLAAYTGDDWDGAPWLMMIFGLAEDGQVALVRAAWHEEVAPAGQRPAALRARDRRQDAARCVGEEADGRGLRDPPRRSRRPAVDLLRGSQRPDLGDHDRAQGISGRSGRARDRRRVDRRASLNSLPHRAQRRCGVDTHVRLGVEGTKRRFACRRPRLLLELREQLDRS